MGISERKEREKEQRRNDIVDAAEMIFQEKGLRAATMDEVAEKAELSKGTLYLYFKSKEDLAFAISLRGISILTRLFQDAVASDNNGKQKIRDIGYAYTRFFEEHPFYSQMIGHTSEMNTGEDLPFKLKCGQEGRKTFEIMIAALQQGMGDGSIRKDIDPVATALLLSHFSYGMMFSIVNGRELIEEVMKVEIRQYVESGFDFMARALEP